MKQPYDHSFHAYIQGIIMIGFALFMLWLVLSGNIVFYIAPLMMPFIYFAIVSFFVLGIMQVFRSTSNKGEEHENCGCEHDHQIKGPPWVKVIIYSIFILPIIFGFILPDRMLNSEAAANRGVQYGSGLSTSSVTTPVTSSGEAVDNNGQDGETIEHVQLENYYEQDWFNDYYDEMAEEFSQQDIIMVTEENYIDVMTVLDLYLDLFVGKEIEIIGFAFREPEFEEHQIVIARFSMTCCTADVGVYGTLVESEDAYQFDDDTWLYAKGTIQKGTFNNMVLPIIVDTYLVEVEQPANPYVYPTWGR
ncbi:MAG: TIGR03943 family protein [Bacillus sp. (in: Bacteria)]|nr:TIGR03943 family protein [Bacillus sp. (in: firmicutes)]